MNFNPLVLEAGARPMGYVTFNVEPHDVLGQYAHRSSDNRVGEFVLRRRCGITFRC